MPSPSVSYCGGRERAGERRVGRRRAVDLVGLQQVVLVDLIERDVLAQLVVLVGLRELALRRLDPLVALLVDLLDGVAAAVADVVVEQPDAGAPRGQRRRAGQVGERRA